MSRNFISEQTLIDQLLLDDTSAFEELYHRYCYSLYTYSLNKLDSPEDAKRIVRDIFIALWEQRHSLPVDFSISLHLYTEVRKSVVKIINEKLLDSQEVLEIEKRIIPGFSLMQLKRASKPVRLSLLQPSVHHRPVQKNSGYNEMWWSRYSPVNVKTVRHTFQQILNFW